MKVYTETGSVYRFEDGYVTRSNEDADMRRDEEPMWVYAHTPPEVGSPMLITMQLLDDPDVVTQRTTSLVTRVER